MAGLGNVCSRRMDYSLECTHPCACLCLDLIGMFYFGAAFCATKSRGRHEINRLVVTGQAAEIADRLGGEGKPSRDGRGRRRIG